RWPRDWSSDVCSSDLGYGPGRHNLTVAAQALGLHLRVVELHSADEVDHAFPALTREGAEALMVLADALLLDGLRGRIVALAAAQIGRASCRERVGGWG